MRNHPENKWTRQNTLKHPRDYNQVNVWVPTTLLARLPGGCAANPSAESCTPCTAKQAAKSGRDDKPVGA